MNNKILSLHEVSKKFKSLSNEVLAVNKVSLDVYCGEILIIMGSSGSGKSTLLNIIGGLIGADSGNIFIEDNLMKNYACEPFATNFRRENIGFIFQSFNLLNNLTVEENINLVKRKKSNNHSLSLDEVLTVVELSKKKKSLANTLSGGEQQRVAIARALINNPKFILADEPTGNLDSKLTINIMKKLEKSRIAYNQTIVLVTHDPLVATFGDRVVFLEDGEVSNVINVDQTVERKKNMFNIMGHFNDLLSEEIKYE